MPKKPAKKAAARKPAAKKAVKKTVAKRAKTKIPVDTSDALEYFVRLYSSF